MSDQSRLFAPAVKLGLLRPPLLECALPGAHTQVKNRQLQADVAEHGASAPPCVKFCSRGGLGFFPASSAASISGPSTRQTNLKVRMQVTLLRMKLSVHLQGGWEVARIQYSACVNTCANPHPARGEQSHPHHSHYDDYATGRVE
jgi:hypothetical protein